MPYQVGGGKTAAVNPYTFRINLVTGINGDNQPVDLGQAVGVAGVLRATISAGPPGSPTITSGAGAPTSTQPVGSIYLCSDGAAGSRLYVSAGGGTWTAVAAV